MDSLISEFAFSDSLDHYKIDTHEEVTEEAEAIARAIIKFYNLQKDEVTEEVSDWAKEAWAKAKAKDINDGIGSKNSV